LEHLDDEEKVVFPAYKNLEQELTNNPTAMVGGFDDAVSWMEEDHILTDSSLKSLRNYCNNYVAPSGSSPGFKILFEELKKFEKDTHFHIYLESNVLFAKVLALLHCAKH
jgi:iron-sulfur cluster repair protein YtfE (RIC family)